MPRKKSGERYPLATLARLILAACFGGVRVSCDIISGFSHVLFDDGRTLPAMERGELGLSVGRLLRADKILRDLERQAIKKGSR